MTYLKSNDLFGELNPETLFERVPRPMVIADHLMTPDNIGAMIRLADNIGASEVCFLGNEDEHRLGKVRRAAASSRDNIRWYFSEENDLRKLVPKGRKSLPSRLPTTPHVFTTPRFLKMWPSLWAANATA